MLYSCRYGSLLPGNQQFIMPNSIPLGMMPVQQGLMNTSNYSGPNIPNSSFHNISNIPNVSQIPGMYHVPHQVSSTPTMQYGIASNTSNNGKRKKKVYF